uniref:Uncharacterized protein n=1 Tax=Strigamia maritima TaxID=126957 RepID=T1IR22_STRMM
MYRVQHRCFSHLYTPIAPNISILGQDINYYRHLENYHTQTENLDGHFYSTIWGQMPHGHPVFDMEEVMEEPLNTFDRFLCPPFENQLYRFAFCYLYFTCQTHAITILWRKLAYRNRPSANLNNWFHDIFLMKKVNVFCFGGGAGSEIVGFYQWLKVIQTQPRFHCTIIDVYNWVVETKPLFRKIDSNLFVPSFHELQFLKIFPFYTDKSRISHDLCNADLITVGKYLSSLPMNFETVMHFKCLLDQMKSKALLFFIDDVGNGYVEAMGNIAICAGLDQIGEIGDITIPIPNYEVEAMNAEHFNIRPNTSIRVCASLWQKP